MRYVFTPLLALIFAAIAGCGNTEVVYPDRAPLPVTVMTLRNSVPTSQRLYAGSVRSWKTEEIAFEVNGRVEWVVEPGTEIEARTFNKDGSVLTEGTQIAQLDPARFMSALESAASQVRIAELKRDSAATQIRSGMPAEKEAAEAERDLAQSEYDRARRLVKQGAGAGKNVESTKAALDGAISKLNGLNSKLEQAESELKSAEAAIEQARQTQKDSQRDLRDTKLYSAFSGQISEVFVVPGSLTNQQGKAVSIQMMNPIKVELEVSAETSRRVQLNDTVPLVLTTPEGKRESTLAVVYTIAPSADNATRTFTLTLLLPNRKVEMSVPEGFDSKVVARARHLWRVDLGILPDADEGKWYMPESALFADEKGEYVLKLKNLSIGQPSKRMLKVKKIYVTADNEGTPFLGKERFKQVAVLTDQDFNPNTDFFVSNMSLPENAEWNGEDVLLDNGGRWLIRPGDVVDVDLAGGSQAEGLYVPTEAIREDVDGTSIFVVDSNTARQVMVTINKDDSRGATSIHRIEPVDTNEQLDGTQIIVEGVHYVVDGESVSVTNAAGEGE